MSQTNYLTIDTGSYQLRGIHHQSNNPQGLVIMFHGYTGHKNENGYLFKTLAQQLAKNGYDSLRFDFYGNGDSDGNFEDMTYQTLLEDASTIINYGLELINKSINKSMRLIVLGFSMGGLISLEMGLRYQQISQLVLLAPAINFDLLVSNRFKNNRLYLDHYLDCGGFLVSDQLLNTIKYQVESFKDIQVSSLIIQGTLDQAVDYHYSQELSLILPNNQLHLIHEATHCFTTIKHRQMVNEQVIKFIKEGEK